MTATEPPREGKIRRLVRAVRRHARLLWLLAVGALVLAFVYHQHDEIARIVDTLRRTQPGWLLLAGLLELVALGLMGRTYQLLLRRLGHRLPLPALVGAYLQGFVVGAVVPFGGPTSVYIFVRRVERHGVAADDAVLASALGSLVGFTSFLLTLAPALAVLAIDRRLSDALVAAATLFALTFALLVAAVLLVLRGPPPPGWLLGQVPARVRQFVEHARERRIRARELAGPLATSICVDLVGMSMLYAALRAVGERPSVLLPLAGYQVEMLFNLIAPLFQGVGLVEVSMTVALAGLGVPGVTAVAATLVYRLWDLWLPLLLGLLIHLRHGWTDDARDRQVDVPSSPGRDDPEAGGSAGAKPYPGITTTGATGGRSR